MLVTQLEVLGIMLKLYQIPIIQSIHQRKLTLRICHICKKEIVVGQYKYYINWGFKRCLLGFEYERGFSIQVYLLFIIFGIGMTSGAKGFGCWRV